MNPVKTLCFTLSLVALLAVSAAAQTRTVYFFPPDDAKWIAGRSYISDGSTATALTIESSKCGWYKATISSSSDLLNRAQFWLGKPGIDKIGPNGRLSVDFDSGVNFAREGGVFALKDIFDRLGNNIYFVADELDASDPNSGWYGSMPPDEDKTRCEFALAAFIYDTDPAVHPDFSCGTWRQGASDGNGKDTKGACEEGPQAYSGAGGNLKPNCTGVVKGLVKQTLNSTTKKIECDNCTKNGCWTSADWFNKAFTPTKGVNVERCYNMPFTQIKSGQGVGSFEFDSDKMLNASGRLVGGFFPEILHNAPNDTDCPSCNTKRTADRFPPRIAALTKEAFDAYQSKEGDFADGDTPTRSAFGLTPATESIYDWGARPDSPTATGGATWAPWYLHGTTNMKTAYKSPQAEYDAAAKANQHFCFESHADFYYDPDQVFYFSGDDPIWVYINNKLVIDLGGAHMAAPGHVELKTLGLTEGTLYPIDIFFCDQRTVNSNARITTNMYVVQKASFWSNNTGKRDQPMCAEVSGGSDCASKMSGSNSTSGETCGQALIDNGFKVQFYMFARGNTRDTIWLDPTKNSKNCTGSANNWSCYRGIKGLNAVYSCGEKNQCRGDEKASEKVDLVGNYNVYARLVNSSNQVVGKPIPIDNIRSASNTRIIWGSATPWPSDNNANPQPKELKDAYGDKTTREQNIIAGRRTPIYISSGSWDGVGSYTSFSYDDDASNTAGFSVTISGNTGLKIYDSETGGTGKTSWEGNLVNGMATLWVEGGYDIGNKTFKLNVTSEGDDSPSLTINVYQPELRFSETADGTSLIRSPDGWQRWKTTGGNPPTDQPPFVGQSLDKIYLVAWDGKRGELCKTCAFTLKSTSTTNNAEINSKNGERIVTSNATTITAGIVKDFYLSGSDEVLGNNRAEWEVWGPSKEQTNVKWTGLQFKTSPVPTPVKSIIFDRNGDGIGDSLIVEFTRSFRKDTSATSGELNDTALIVLLEVAWAKGEEPIRFHAPQYSVEQLKNKDEVRRLYNTREFFENNRNYWNDKIKGKNIVSVTYPNFSKEIQTIGDGSLVYSYTPFYERDLCIAGTCPDAAFQYAVDGTKKEILDGIPPIVVKAEYTYVSANGANCLDGGSSGLGCKELFVVHLSEPVYAGPDAGSKESKQNPFRYCFGRSQGTKCPVTEITPEQRLDQDYRDHLSWDWEVPQERDYSSIATYKPNHSKNPGEMKDYSDGVAIEDGDDIVDMVYYSKKVNGDQTTRTPKSDDWIKLRSDYKIYQDAAGNFANPREIGVLITGVNPARKKQIKVAEVIADPKAPVLGGTFDGSRNDDYYPYWINDATRDWANGNLYQNGNVAEFLPVPKHITHPDTIKAFYPGSVGTLFDISDRLGQELKKFVQDKCMETSSGKKQSCIVGGSELTEYNIDELAPGAISINASAFYHTNLGDYTAHRTDLKLDCTSQLFQNEAGVGNCMSNNYNFYLAWDLKTNNGRFVGAGAYVAIAKFYWQIKYRDASGNEKVEKFGKDEAIEMFGVRRAPNKR